jgi:hypothetical protein
MRLRLASMPEEPLIQLCRTAEQTTLALGHILGPWTIVEDIARRAVCTKCGRAVYARAEGKLVGIAGRACGERCDA